ncbi:MAG: DUF262 domain-containing protein [Clostridiales bacterium]|nr:DUF262 domain-containing protein [Clostridiales bacterium]
MSNETGAKSLNNIIDGKKFCIPMYQRNYKWNSDVAEKLVTDIISSYEIKNDTNKSLGLITLYHDENKKKYDVIDGQQRFTTLAILLTLLNSEKNIDLAFERDDDNDNKRSLAVKEKCDCACTDVNRINRNRKKMLEVLRNKYGDDSKIPKSALACYILNHVIMLSSIVNTLPVEEFMNLNAYKTAFSICDHIRANLIALNSFHKDDLEKENVAPILARCLSNHSYKTAVAILYNELQKKLYEIEKEEGTYKSVYDLLKAPEIVIEPGQESRINILFGAMLKPGAQNYDSGEITENLDFWIKMLQRLAFVNKILDELKEEFDRGEYHSFKQIDDYQKLTKKSFIREVFDGIDNDWDSQTLAKEIQKYTNIDSVIIRCLQQDSKKLANRYLEAFVYSNVNSESFKQADNEKWKKVALAQMPLEDVVEEISGCGRYIIDRYEIEHREDLNVNIDIPPVLDLEDRENINFGGSLDLQESDEISVGKLFEYKIRIPVIQRDYCMGARITGKNDFLSFLLDGYEKDMNDSNLGKLSASTVLLSVSEVNDNNKILYIFDGQQRTFTLYNILKYCGCEMKEYNFVGRESENRDIESNSHGSPYSKAAVDNLKCILEKKIKDKKDFAEYIKEKVFLKVKIVDNVSGAEQFFMDINGGVALKKYEIYKAMLCDRLSKLGKTDVVRKIENKWLDFFYKYRKDYLKVVNIENDERDDEELLEIRFIEYVCRFVYRMNHYGATYEDIWEKNESGEFDKKDEKKYGKSDSCNECEELLSFDEIESKGDLIAKLSYISDLNENDIDNVCTIMEAITSDELKKGEDCSIEFESEWLQTNSKNDGVFIYRLTCKGNKQKILDKMDYYVMRFIWSLTEGNREILEKYYRYKDIGGLVKICDDDQIMRDIILTILQKDIHGDAYPYQLYWGNINYFYCGYNHNGNNASNVANKSINNKYVKEIPAYYYNELPYEDKCVRLQYLQEKARPENSNDALFFALVKNNFVGQIKYEDGKNSNVCLLSGDLSGYKCTNRTEAYCLVYITDKIKKCD